MDALELWRLTDHYNVEDAAILIAGGEPNYHRSEALNAHRSFQAAIDTVETALKRAILKNSLRADLVFHADGFWEIKQISETMEPFETWRAIVAMTRDEHFPLQTGKGLRDLSGLQGLKIYPEPDWDRTLIRAPRFLTDFGATQRFSWRDSSWRPSSVGPDVRGSEPVTLCFSTFAG